MSLNAPISHWHGRTVWLIGASSGIGLATAALLHRNGAHVWVSARNTQALEDFAQRHPGARILSLDVMDESAWHSAVEHILKQGRLDDVVYCAAHYVPMQATRPDLPSLLQHIEVNYVGALRMLEALMPHLLAQQPHPQTGQRAHISLIASVAGYRGLPQSLAYGPTKAALIHLAEILYQDLRPHSIGVSLVNQGLWIPL